jgi:hypothetical protein
MNLNGSWQPQIIQQVPASITTRRTGKLRRAKAQPFLSGLTAKDRDMLRTMAFEKFAPVPWAQMLATNSMHEKLKATRASFEREYLKSLPVRSAKQDAADTRVTSSRSGPGCPSPGRSGRGGRPWRQSPRY